MNANSICKFKVSKDTNDRCPVFLLSFSNGCLNFDNSCELGFSSFIHEKDLKKDEFCAKGRRIVVAASNRLVYKGCTFEEDSGFKLPFQYLIGVRNKVNGKMKLYNCIILRLKPVMKVNVNAGLSNEITQGMNYREKLDQLSMSFGNKSKKRVLNARLKYAVDSAPSPSDVLENITINEPTSKKLQVGTASGIDYIPPQNCQARFPSEVYDIYDVISQEEEEHLSNIAQALLTENSYDFEKWKNRDSFCKYVLSHLERGIDEENLNYLLYFNYMVTFAKLNYSDINKKDPAPNIPEPFKTKLLDNFTVSTCNEHGKSSRNLPAKMKDKLFAYMLVLALIIDDFCVGIPYVLDGLKRGLPSAISVAQALGCHIVQRRINDSVMKFAELKLPLATFSRYPKKGY